MTPSYFGEDECARFARGLKSLNDAETIRSKILSAVELAESTDDPKERARQMTFVLVGAGPTGVELAASIAQLAAVTLRKNFRKIDPAKSRIVLLDGGARVLPTFAESLSRKAAKRLTKLGVEVSTGVKVEKVDDEGVIAAGVRIPSATVLWAAGVSASPVVKMLGTQTDRAGRAFIGAFMDIPEAPNVFVVGDAATMTQDGHPVPGVTILGHRGCISHYKDIGRLGDVHESADECTPGAVCLRPEHFHNRRGANACCPKHGGAGDPDASRDHALVVNLLDLYARRNFNAELR